jgi:hypothetical protein
LEATEFKKGGLLTRAYRDFFNFSEKYATQDNIDWDEAVLEFDRVCAYYEKTPIGPYVNQVMIATVDFIEGCQKRRAAA